MLKFYAKFFLCDGQGADRLAILYGDKSFYPARKKKASKMNKDFLAAMKEKEP